MSNEEWIPGSKTELMAEIKREWNLLMAVVARLDETKMTTPDEGGWSPKDNLAHLTEWMNSLMGYHMDQRPAAPAPANDNSQTAAPAAAAAGGAETTASAAPSR